MQDPIISDEKILQIAREHKKWANLNSEKIDRETRKEIGNMACSKYFDR
jgi:hypothetical protein